MYQLKSEMYHVSVIKSEIYHVSTATAISSPGKGFKVERCGGSSFIRIYIIYTIRFFQPDFLPIILAYAIAYCT